MPKNRTKELSGTAGRTSTASTRRHPGATRAAILSSAVTLFEASGFSATSVQQIVDKAGCTKGAFYHYFESKEDLLHEIHDHFIDYQLERARSVLARDLPADQLLAAFITEALMEPMGKYKAEITIYLHEQRFLDEKSFVEIRNKREEYTNIVVQLVERGVREGVLRDLGPARIVAFAIIGVGAWTHTWMTTSGSLTAHDIGELFGGIMLDGLRD